MAETKEIKQISVNGTLYSVGGGNTEAAFTLTENNGAKMSACTSTGDYAVAEGSGTTASGNYSHAEGSGSIASGYCSHAEGSGSIAGGSTSHAEGLSTKASGNYSHAEGCSTSASGNYSHAEGRGTTASGQSSHAEGENTVASGKYSHAEGYGTTASGNYSHAEGSNTTASGSDSHAEGISTKASGDDSHAEGCGTSATTMCEHASGYYNVSLSGSSNFGDSGNTLFTVGNGYRIYTNNKVTTHNAFEIRQNGDIYISDTNAEGEYYQKPMIKLQDALANAGGSGGGVDLQELIKGLQQEISTLKEKVAVLESNEVTKAEVEKGFNNVITVVDDTLLKIRNNALEDEGIE